jgi:hypothetical protein
MTLIGILTDYFDHSILTLTSKYRGGISILQDLDRPNATLGYQGKWIIIIKKNILATAQEFIEEGARVIITGRHQETLNQTVASLGSNAFGIVCDNSNVLPRQQRLPRQWCFWRATMPLTCTC